MTNRICKYCDQTIYTTYNEHKAHCERQTQTVDFEDIQPNHKHTRQARTFYSVINKKFPDDFDKLSVLKALKQLIVEDLIVGKD